MKGSARAIAPESLGGDEDNAGHICLSAKSKAAPVGTTRPRSPSVSPLPRQRADIARRTIEEKLAAAEKKITLLPPDWQCPNRKCQNYVRMVFSCPICGSPRPSSSTGTSGTERMRDGFRKFHPAPGHVSHGWEHGDRRAYRDADVGVLSHMCPQLPHGSVEPLVSKFSLQVELPSLDAGGAEVGIEKPLNGDVSARVGPFSIDSEGGTGVLNLAQTHVKDVDEVCDVDSVGDMSIDTTGIHLAMGHNGTQLNHVVGGLFVSRNAGVFPGSSKIRSMVVLEGTTSQLENCATRRPSPRCLWWGDTSISKRSYCRRV